jgi:hypothetical protein
MHVGAVPAREVLAYRLLANVQDKERTGAGSISLLEARYRLRKFRC